VPLSSLRIRHPIPLVTSLITAMTVAGCADAGPVAPNREPIDAVGPAALAKGSGGADVAKVDVTFTMPGGTCGLTTTVTATGVYNIVTRETESPTGELRLYLTEAAHGTGTGADGSRYRFSYAANYSFDPTTLPFLLDLVDHFNLLGQGGAPDVKVYLRGQFLFDGSLPLIPVGDPVIRGGVACDPI
jgi:hypothetical protein